MEVYTQKALDAKQLKCPNCGWEGKGSETYIIDFYGMAEVKEVHCPKCDETLGGVTDISDPLKRGDADI